MSFERSLSIASDLEDIINEEVRATSLVLLRDVVIATPVDTGRARGNWVIGVTTPVIEQFDNFDKTGGETIRRGATRIGDARAIKYPTINLTNSLPYVTRLNQGWSQQAPAMFVESAIIRAVNRR